MKPPLPQKLNPRKQTLIADKPLGRFWFLKILILTILIVFLLGWYFQANPIDKDSSKKNNPTNTCTKWRNWEEHTEESKSIAIKNLTLKIANTNTTRTLGLSNTCTLPTKEGLLFAFESIGSHGIWMKDMHYAIDIAWLDKNGIIIYTQQNVSPDTFPAALAPSLPSACFVIELAAGTLASQNISNNFFATPILLKHSLCEMN